MVLYRDKLPKFNNHGQMILNHMPWPRESKTVPKIHPTQKPIALLKRLIEIFTELRAAAEMGRTAYGFEVDKRFYKLAQEKMLNNMETPLFAEV